MFATVLSAGPIQTSNWTGGLSNLWTIGSNWDNGVPQNSLGNNFSAIIGSTANNPVLLNGSLTVTNLTLVWVPHSLTIQSGSTLTVDGGTLSNNGTIAGAVTLAGAAIAELAGGSVVTGLLTNSSTGQINGHPGSTISGLVNPAGGNVNLLAMKISNGTLTNDGTITAAGTITVLGSAVLNGSGAFNLNGATLFGG